MQTQESAIVEERQWFVLRDLKRPNSKTPAYKVLPELGFEVFTPMHWVVKDNHKGGKTRLYIPFIAGLLFANSVKSQLDEVIDKTETLQYRFVKGAAQNTPMVVPTQEMANFINAVTESQNCTYYSPEEITPDMFGKKVRVVGGFLDGTVGYLMKRQGSKKKRLLLTIKDTLVASVEIESVLIQPV